MTDYLQLLRSVDDPIYAEQPLGFDRNKAETTFTLLAQEIVTQYPGSKYETGIRIQDASYHGEIFVASQSHFALVRASNFGNFITIFDEDICLPHGAVEKLLMQFQKHHYVYIPADALDAKYDGKNPGVSGFNSWRYRYFDYI